MLTLITGAPGSSKTSHVIDSLMDEKDRPIFYYNIPLTDDGKTKLGWIEFTQDQVLDWQSELPPNAILIVDECQRIWPVRSSAKPVHPSCVAMETHRHQGVDIVFITQHEGLIDSHIRKLINEHKHYSRPFGMPFAVQYHSGSGAVSTSSKTDLAQCTESKKPLPKRTWGLYKSAEVHTHKAKVPKVVYFVVATAAHAVIMIYKFTSSYGVHDEAPQTTTVDSAGIPQRVTNTQQQSRPWVELLKPEIDGLPFTAPLYREEATKVKAVPKIAGCAKMPDHGCQCYTQQGTKITGMSDTSCNRFLENPWFDHMRDQKAIDQSRMAALDEAEQRSDAGARAWLIDERPNVSVTR